MTSQRIAGWWLSGFTAYVIGNHLALGGLSWFDVSYGIAAIPILLSGILEGRLFKALQIGAVASVGVIIALFDTYGRPVGYSILSTAFIFMFAYGFMESWMKTKVSFFLVIYAFVYLLGVPGPESQLSWFIMALTVPGGLWLAVREMVQRDRKASALKEIVLRHQLGVVRELLDEAVAAGLILSDEVKRNAGGKDAGGR